MSLNVNHTFVNILALFPRSSVSSGDQDPHQLPSIAEVAPCPRPRSLSVTSSMSSNHSSASAASAGQLENLAEFDLLDYIVMEDPALTHTGHTHTAPATADKMVDMDLDFSSIDLRPATQTLHSDIMRIP